MAERRQTNVASLSFLDVMSCGFGAIILLYFIVNRAVISTTDVHSETSLIEELIEKETKQLVILRNTVKEQNDEIATNEDLAIQVIEKIQALKQELSAMESEDASQLITVELLKSELKTLELEVANLENSLASDDSTGGTSLRSIEGQGDRQYLTGMKVGGQRVLILLDASASMLDKTIVNIIRRRNLPVAKKLQSEKWQRAVNTVEWILANLPKDTKFQLVTFNNRAHSAIENTDMAWLQASKKADIDKAMKGLHNITPQGGSSLHHPFLLASKLSPSPDNIFLIVDSLPTIGSKEPKRGVIESRERVELFAESIELLPFEIPVNVILFPMEGDPMAAPSYWRLAQITGGSFLSPPEDWP